LQKFFSKQEIKDNKFDFESIEVQRFDFVQSVIYLRQLKLAQDRFDINILKEISNFCEGNPSLLKILGLIAQFAQGNSSILERIKLLPVHMLE